jgi:alkanesulfonate monooxygenase SsuD/methylene tetrahydromethanopterin reductase-like flavin-dependent oxidoreductase (luciferase family)
VKFGVFASAVYPGDMTSTEAWDLTLEITHTARDSGFDGVFVAEHHLLGPDSMTLPPFTALGRLSGEFPGGFLGTAIHLLPLSHPVQTASSASFLDMVTQGKFILGVGQGYREVEFKSLGIPIKERGERLREGVAAMKTLWQGDHVSFDGKYYSFEDVSLAPRPFTEGGPPVWVGSDVSKSIARVPRFADAWIASGRQSRTFIREAAKGYRETFAELGKPFPGVPMFRELHVAENSKLARDEVRDVVEEMFHTYHSWGQPGEGYDVSVEELMNDRMVVGDPQEVTALLIEYIKEFNVPFMWFRVYFPGMAKRLVLETIRLLGEEVLPQVRAAL